MVPATQTKVSFTRDTNSVVRPRRRISTPFGAVRREERRQSVLHFAARPELKRSLKSSSTICEAVAMIRAEPRGSAEAQVLFCASL